MDLVTRNEVIRIARSCIGVTRYELRAHPDLAPDVVDCSSFTGYVYRTAGVTTLPRYARQQHALCSLVRREEIQSGDLVILRSKNHQDIREFSPDHVGHIGIVTNSTHYIHAASTELGVIEVSIDEINPERLLGFGRLPN